MHAAAPNESEGDTHDKHYSRDLRWRSWTVDIKNTSPGSGQRKSKLSDELLMNNNNKCCHRILQRTIGGYYVAGYLIHYANIVPPYKIH